MRQNFRMIAKTFAGLEQVLADELKELNARDIEIKKRAVSFFGDTGLLYQANYCSHTAIDILLPVHSFSFDSQEEYYKQIRKTIWEKYLGPGDTFIVDATVNRSTFTHSGFVARFTKDAIADQFMDNYGRRPSIDKENPTLRINIHISGQNCSVALNSSGDPLFKRGYRKRTGPAPLNEVLAAGLIKLSGWNQKDDFYDLMCGSGTILIEAAMMSLNMPPGMFRQSFGFEKWKSFDPELWEQVREKAKSGIRQEGAVIRGSDISRKMIFISRHNIEAAGLDEHIRLKNYAFGEYVPEKEPGFMILNPPYGERMEKSQTVNLYKEIGDHLKQHFNGFTAWILSSDIQALKTVGLKPSKRITVFNGPLECKFVKFEMYKGSKKAKYQN